MRRFLHFSRHFQPVLLLAILLGAGPARSSAQVVWDNGNGNFQWGTGANWSTNTVPNAGSAVQFNATPNVTSSIQLGGNRSADSLTFNNADDTFSIVNGTGSNTLTLTSGNITRSTGSSGTQTLAFTTLALANNSTMAISGTGSLVISSAITETGGSRGITKSGSGLLQLSGANTYTGNTTLSGGALALGNNNALGTGILVVNGGTTVQGAGGARTVGNDVTLNGDFTIGGTSDLTLTGDINLNGATRTITVNNTGTTTFAGSVTEPWYSGLTKAGAGELVLSGNNTFTAPATVNAGTLTLANSNALGGAGTANNVVASGATLALQNNVTVNEGSFSVGGTGVGGTGAIRNVSGTNTLGGTINLQTATTIVATAGSLTFTGDLNASSNLTTSGAGNLTFSGGGYGGGSITQNGNGSGGGTLTFSGATATSLSGVLNINDGTVVLAKTAGTTALASSAINIGNGAGATGSAVLRLDASHQISDSAGLITIKSDGTLNLNNFAESVNALTSTGRIDLGTSGTLTLGVNSGNSSLGGTILGTGTLAKEGAGTLALLSSIVLAGELRLNAGTLALGGFNLTAGTLHVTGSSIIDFAGGNSTLNLANFVIDAGVTLTVQNWANAADYFYTQGWTGASFSTAGAAPMNQVVFTGYSAANTHWQTDFQVTPVPEPSTYGALLLGGLGAWAGLRRYRRSRR